MEQSCRRGLAAPSPPFLCIVAAVLAAWSPLLGSAGGPPQTPTNQSVAPDLAADGIAATLEDPVASIVREVLERNPELGRLRALLAAAEERAPQARALPDPTAALTAFLLTPETRVGPQQASVSVSQRLPWFGKLSLRGTAAQQLASAARAELEAKRLELLTEVRRLAYELGFLDAQQVVIESDRATLVRYEGLARARYASGVGLQLGTVKLQTEISRDDNRLLEIAHRRATLVAALDALAARGPGRLPPTMALPSSDLPQPRLTGLDDRARRHRPEIARAHALIDAAATGQLIAEKEYRPDLVVGLGYTAVGGRDDAPGRALPPPGNGQDIVALTFGVNLPVWRDKLAAGVAEAAARAQGAREELRAVETRIDQALAELAARLPLTLAQVRLLEDLIVPQAEQALDSTESAYAAGVGGALDLLDAERTLLDARTAAARLRADYLIALARLEGAIGAPLEAGAKTQLKTQLETQLETQRDAPRESSLPGAER